MSAEDEAKSRIDSARQRAQAIRTEADEAASALIGKAREKAVADSRLMLDKARNASEESLLKARAEGDSAGASFVESAQRASSELVERIVGMISGQPS